MKKIICILLLLSMLALCFVSCDGGNNSDDDGICDVCGGDGVVTQKFLGSGSGIQQGFDTYYRCKGCQGTGRD